MITALENRLAAYLRLVAWYSYIGQHSETYNAYAYQLKAERYKVRALRILDAIERETIRTFNQPTLPGFNL